MDKSAETASRDFVRGGSVLVPLFRPLHFAKNFVAIDHKRRRSEVWLKVRRHGTMAFTETVVMGVVRDVACSSESCNDQCLSSREGETAYGRGDLGVTDGVSIKIFWHSGGLGSTPQSTPK